MDVYYRIYGNRISQQPDEFMKYFAFEPKKALNRLK